MPGYRKYPTERIIHAHQKNGARVIVIRTLVQQMSYIEPLAGLLQFKDLVAGLLPSLSTQVD